MKVQLKSSINTKKLEERESECKWGEGGSVEAVCWGKGWLSGAEIEEKAKLEINGSYWELTDIH